MGGDILAQVDFDDLRFGILAVDSDMMGEVDSVDCIFGISGDN